MKKTLSIVMCVLLVLLAVACNPETPKAHVCADTDWEVVKETKSTCTVLGKTIYKCKECGATKEVMATELAPHTPDESISVAPETPATCMTDGFKMSVCSVCGLTYAEKTDAKHTGSYKHVYKTNDEDWSYDNTTPLGNSDDSHVKWVDVTGSEASEFKTGTQKATCPGCGDEIYFYTDSTTASNSCWKTVDEENTVDTKTGVYKSLDGLWTWKTAATMPTTDGSAYQQYFLFSGDEKTQTTNAVNVLVAQTTYTLNGTTQTTSNELIVSTGTSVTASANGTGARKFTYTPTVGVYSSKEYTFSQGTDGKITVSIENGVSSGTPLVVELTRVVAEDGDDFTSEDWLNGDSVRMDSTSHYIGETACGLKNLKVAHNTDGYKKSESETISGACSVCGYKSDSVWTVKVTLSDTDADGSSAVDTYCVLKGDSIELPLWKDGKLYKVFGTNTTYKAKKYSTLSGTFDITEMAPTSNVVIYLEEDTTIAE